MDELERLLDRWVDAGILTPEQARTVVAFERDGRRPPEPAVPAAASALGAPGEPPAAGPAVSAPPAVAPPAGAVVDARQRRGVVAEAVGYVGAALALGAAAILLAQLWPQLTTGGRLILVALLMIVLAGAAAALWRSPAAALRRLTHALAAAAALAAGWLVGLVTGDLLDLDPAPVGLAVGVVLLVAAGGPLLVRPSIPGQVVALSGAVTVAIAALALPALRPDLLYGSLLVWAVALGWALVARGGWLRPTVVGEVLGVGVALLAAQVASSGSHRAAGLTLFVVTAVVLVWLAVALDGVHLLVLGGIGLFVAVPQLVVELFGDTIGAPATMLLVGLLLVLAAVGIGRVGREVRRDPPVAAHDEEVAR